MWDDFIARVWEEGWTYVKAVVDIAREPVLILDTELRVTAVNDEFCRTFQINRTDAELVPVYELGNGQWNIPELRRLLEDILPANAFFKGFELVHDFPFVGRKVLLVNARQFYFAGSAGSKLFPDIILLAIEDVTEIMSVAETLVNHTHHMEEKLEENISERTNKLENQIKELERQIKGIKGQK